MKISAFWKSSLREIKHSFGRFIAIFVIVAIGVGFFAGLKITKDVMVVTTQKYYEEKQFYDFRLLSTLGFDKDAVAVIGANHNVKSVAGALNFDIMYHDNTGNDQALRVHSITDDLNEVELTAGRMPESADECIVDDLFFSEKAVGTTLYLSEANEEEDLENFRFKEYQIVGICKSSYYIHYDRGTTSVGNGKVACFAYMLPEAFDADYYTEIFVKLQEEHPLFSEEYDEYIDGLESEFETLAKNAAADRYPHVIAEGNKELADAKETLAEEKAEAEAELADAWQELEDARVELADAEQEIADGRKELDDAYEEIEKNKEKLEKNEKLLAEKEQELADGLVEYEEGYKQWQEKKAQLDEAEATLQSQSMTLEMQKVKIAEQEAMIAYTEGMMGGSIHLFPDVAEQLAKGKELLAAGKAQIAGYEVQMNQGKAELAQGSKAMQEGDEELKNAKKQLEDGKIALQDGKEEIEKGKKQLEEAEAELAEAEIAWQDGKAEYEDGLKKYQDGLKEYEEGKAEFEEEIVDAEKKLADAETALAEIMPPDVYVLGRDANVGYVCFENDSSIITGIANVFPFFFFLVAALVCVTTMNRMVEEQRTQIGVLKALGYSRVKIMGKYFFYAGLAAVAGCALGYFGGSYLFPAVIWYAYGIMYRVDTMVYILDPRLAVISLVASLLASVGATWWTCRSELNQVAAQLIRPKAPQAGKRIFLEYVPILWNRLGFLKKVSIRNIFRYKKRLFMMVTGISGCTALLVTGFGVKDSIANVVNQQYHEIQIFDISVDYEEEVTAQQLKAIGDVAGVNAYTLLSQGSIDVVTEDVTKTVNMIIFPEEGDISPFVNLHTTDGAPISYPGAGEAVISNKLAGKMGVDIGDEVRLRTEDMEEFTATVTGIHRNFVNNYVYISSDTYVQGTGSKAEQKTVYVNAGDKEKLYELSAELMKLEGVLAVTVNQDTMDMLSAMMESLDLIVLFIIVCAAGLAFVVLYNLTNINIMERIREIATIKVLGFYKNETRSYVFRENMMLAFMGSIVGLLLGKWLHAFVMAQVNIDMVSFDVHVEPVSYLYSIVLTLGFALFVGLVMGKKLEDISMTESLKSVD